MDRKEEKLIKDVYEKMNLSVRAYEKILKVARTIADLKGKNKNTLNKERKSTNELRKRTTAYFNIRTQRTYEVTVTVTAHEDMIFTILSQSRRFMAQDIKLGKGESTDITSM